MPSSIGAIALTVALLITPAGAHAFDEIKYPDLKGQWVRVGPPRWTAGGQKAPLTPEYQKIFEANLADMANGGPGNVPVVVLPAAGMPMMMNIYDPMEIVVTPDITYILISHVNDSYRRIYTDGRDWPTEDDSSRPMPATRSANGSTRTATASTTCSRSRRATSRVRAPTTRAALPLHNDNQTIVKERIYLDKADKNILYDEITVIDNALTRPWSITKKCDPQSRTAAGLADRSLRGRQLAWSSIGNDTYFLSADG